MSMIKITVMEMKCEKRIPKPYFNVKFKFEPPINVEKLAESNANIEYDPQLNMKAAIIDTKYGKIQVWKNGAQLPRLREDREDIVFELKRYLMALVNGEKRSFVDWLKDDLKKFSEEIGF